MEHLPLLLVFTRYDGGFSMAMSVYRRVDDIFSYRLQVLPSLRQPRGQAELEEMLALPEALLSEIRVGKG